MQQQAVNGEDKLDSRGTDDTSASGMSTSALEEEHTASTAEREPSLHFHSLQQQQQQKQQQGSASTPSGTNAAHLCEPVALSLPNAVMTGFDSQVTIGIPVKLDAQGEAEVPPPQPSSDGSTDLPWMCRPMSQGSETASQGRQSNVGLRASEQMPHPAGTVCNQATLHHEKPTSVSLVLPLQCRSKKPAAPVESGEQSGDITDDSIDVPSDEESPPRGPPSARHPVSMLAKVLQLQTQPEWRAEHQRRQGLNCQAPLTSPRQVSPLPGLRPARPVGNRVYLPSEWEAQFQCYNRGGSMGTKSREEADLEEDEWLKRHKLTGSVARMVHYLDTDVLPSEDILGLRPSGQGRVTVTRLRDEGPAARAGVVVGDQLVSIDGERGFDEYKANVMLRTLRAPAILIFLGFVGKLQAEVRVKQPDRPRCGMSADMAVVDQSPRSSSSCVQQCDVVVFARQAGSSVMITSDKSDAKKASVMYEIRREDARALLHGALLSGPSTQSDTPVHEADLGWLGVRAARRNQATGSILLDRERRRSLPTERALARAAAGFAPLAPGPGPLPGLRPGPHAGAELTLTDVTFKHEGFGGSGDIGEPSLSI